MAFARMRMGLQQDEFFRLTARLFTAYRREWENENREQRILFGLLRMDVINSGFCRPKEAVRLEDIVPDWKGALPRVQRAPQGRMTKSARNEIANSLRRLFSQASE